MEANPDYPADRFRPDPELLALAYNRMLTAQPPRLRYVRQRWEEAFGAVKVALDAIRDIYPAERDILSEHSWVALGDALTQVTAAYLSLDECSDEVLGELMTGVLEGHITRREQVEE